MGSLYESLGGQTAVNTVVETFYRKVLTDDRVSSFFDDIDMESQVLKQKAFLTMAFGGPTHYTGKDMREGHRHLVERGLNDTHVDVVIELLRKSLAEHGVAAEHINAVANIANSVRDHVLNRATL
jgi:hemoglobin